MEKRLSNKQKSRQRKIEHVRLLRSQGKAKGEVRDKALHFMKMDSKDLQEAFEGNIY
jgi:hypothetical protein